MNYSLKEKADKYDTFKVQREKTHMAYINMLYFSYHRDRKVKEQNVGEGKCEVRFQNLEDRRIGESRDISERIRVEKRKMMESRNE